MDIQTVDIVVKHKTIEVESSTTKFAVCPAGIKDASVWVSRLIDGRFRGEVGVGDGGIPAR